MNILITSVGRRGYLVKYFKQALKDKGKIFATDCSKCAPALYDADNYFIVPKVLDENYSDEIIDICKKNNISGVISTNDIELPVLAENKNKFLKEEINAIVSNQKVIDICYDKYKTFLFLKENNFLTPRTFISILGAKKALEAGDVRFPLLIKPRKGSASVGIQKVESEQELQNVFSSARDIIQEYVIGDEYGVDFFNNAEKIPVAIFAKKKLVMRSGETDKAISVYDKNLIKLIERLAIKMGPYGPMDADLFKRGDDYLIMEINPRFGGGYPLSHALGANFPNMVVSLINKDKLKPSYREYPNNVLMMKQYEIIIKKIKNNIKL